MRPLKPLYAAMMVAQVAGAVLGLWLARHGTWFEDLWTGAALATLPGYLVGVQAQKRWSPANLLANAATVRRIGLAAVVLFLAVLLMPFAVA
jgi:hypothetical protein